MQFGNAADKMLAGLMFITWAAPRAIATLSAEASEFLDSFSESEWRKVHDGLLEALWSLEEVRKPADSGPPIPGGASPRLYLVLGRRGSEEYVKTVVMKRLPRYPEADDTALMFIQEKAIVEACREPNSWDAALDVIKFAYTRGLPFSYSGFRELTPPDDVAEKICGSADEYPQMLVSAAQSRLATSLGASATKLADVARQEGWFR